MNVILLSRSVRISPGTACPDADAACPDVDAACLEYGR